MTPEIVGPMAGATEMTVVMNPMVLPRVSGGASVIAVVISSGIMIAVPDAWMMRASTRTSRLEARLAISVPRENNDIAHTNTGRVFSRCSRKPVTGMTTDMVSRNAVVSHCTASALTLRSCMSRGMATAMSVSLRITTKVATRSRLMTRRLRPALSAATGAIFSADGLPALAELRFKYRTPTYPALLGLNC